MQLLPLKQTLDQMQVKWASIINPLLSNPSLDTSILQSVQLTSGNNVINHLLGRKLQGWRITRMRGTFIEVYDNQDSNPTPKLTLALHSNGSCVIDLEVF